MKRQYYLIPGQVAEARMLQDAMEKTVTGDSCFVHYHASGQTCTEKCHHVEAPILDEGNIL